MGRSSDPAPLASGNPRLAELRRLVNRRRHRDEAGRFVVDGPVLVGEALPTGLVERVFVDAGVVDQFDHVVAGAEAAGVPVHPVGPGVLARIAEPVTPQPIVAVVRRPPAPTAADALTHGGGVLVGDAVADPGNLGALMRVAEAAGLAGVWVVGNGVDPFAPKVVRASAGSVLRIPIAVGSDGPATMAELVDAGHTAVGLRADGIPYDAAELRPPVAIVVGSEAHGISTGVGALITEWVGIPMAGAVESLNAAVAGGVVAMEVARRRRTGSGAPGTDR